MLLHTRKMHPLIAVSTLFKHEIGTDMLVDFMNYFNHGIDCFIDGSTHILRKIIVHSNTVSPLTRY